MRSRLPAPRTALVAAAALLAVPGLLAAPAGAATKLPVRWNGITGLGTLNSPTVPAAGVNDWTCKPTAARPRPVVLVHGTYVNQAANWQAYGPYLRNNGYCVYSFNYGASTTPGDVSFGKAAVPASAAELKAFVEQRVLPSTGAKKVDILGHSQGGMMPRWYIKFLDGAKSVNALVALSPSNHGTTHNGMLTLADNLGVDYSALDPAVRDQTPTSAVMKQLNAGGDIAPGDPVKYTVIQTNADTVITPFASAFLTGAKNITVQNVCPLDLVDHLGIAYDSVVGRLVLNALDPATATAPKCVLVLPYVGG